MFRRLYSITRDNRAATAIEYALIASLIVIAIIGSLQLFASRSAAMWGNVATAVAAAS